MAQDIQKLVSILQGLNENALKEDIRPAFGRSVTAARVAGGKEVINRYKTKAMKSRKSVKIKRHGLSATLTSSGSPLPLSEFWVRDKRPKGVQAEIKRGQKKTLPHAFFVQTGNASVYVREGRSRLPIKGVYTVSYPQMWDDDEVIKAMTERAEEMFAKRLEASINRRLGGY